MKSVFEKDLEFIQLLCNPEYLRWLYNERYFEKAEFKEYLKYLEYFKKPEFLIFLLYPQCIQILEQLLSPEVYILLEDEDFYTKLSNNQYFCWKNQN